MKRIVLLMALAAAGTAQADWTPDSSDKLQVEAAATIERMKAEHGAALDPFFAQAHAIAVFPRIRGGGLIFGWNGGKGVAIVGDRLAGFVRQRRFSLGTQAGYQAEAQLMFFKDAATFERFKQGKLEFTPQASANVLSAGSAANAGFEMEVAVFSLTEGGLMLEAAAGATRYRFRPAD